MVDRDIVVLFVFTLIVSFFCCFASYYTGIKDGKRTFVLELKERNVIEFFVNEENEVDWKYK